MQHCLGKKKLESSLGWLWSQVWRIFLPTCASAACARNWPCMFGTWRRPIDVGWAVGHPNGLCEARPSRPLFRRKDSANCKRRNSMKRKLLPCSFFCFQNSLHSEQAKEGNGKKHDQHGDECSEVPFWCFMGLYKWWSRQLSLSTCNHDQLEASLGQHLKDSEGPWSKWSIQQLTFQFSRRVMDQRSPSEGLLGYVEGRWK